MRSLRDAILAVLICAALWFLADLLKAHSHAECEHVIASMPK